jgi:uncharacterized protein YtpQ (UPF0354 family)
MFPTPVKTFVQPQSVYRLEHPAHWDQVIEKEGQSCGFGPHERDDVGLWISILPMSVDTERLTDDLPELMRQALQNTEAGDLRRDESLRHYGLVADTTKEGEGGHYWVVAGGDVVLFASTQVPAAERDEWNPLFAEVMRTLHITRDEHLFRRQVANDLLAELRRTHPEQDFKYDDSGGAGEKIRGRDRVVYLSNILREVKAAPERREQIIQRFVEKIFKPETEQLGQEIWDEICGCVVPVLKPRDYLDRDGPTQHLLRRDWLDDVFICYVIRSKNLFRFVTGWDVDRWGLTADVVHEQALANLARLPWPRQMQGARMKDGGHVVVVDTDDNLASSRLLHPELHRLFSAQLGPTFCVGVPCRDRLVIYSNRRELKQRIGRRLKKDHDASAYPITPRAFLVTRDGIAPTAGK